MQIDTRTHPIILFGQENHGWKEKTRCAPEDSLRPQAVYALLHYTIRRSGSGKVSKLELFSFHLYTLYSGISLFLLLPSPFTFNPDYKTTKLMTLRDDEPK